MKRPGRSKANLGGNSLFNGRGSRGVSCRLGKGSLGIFVGSAAWQGVTRHRADTAQRRAPARKLILSSRPATESCAKCNSQGGIKIASPY